MSESSSPTYRVDFEPVGKRVEVAPDTTLLKAAQRAGLALASACGGVGNCGQCRVEIRAGSVSSHTSDELVILTEMERQRGLQIAERANYLELTTYPKFSRRFALGMLFPSIERKRA
jgi:uncharacterized 2Fe-2S/4Fe-4S cluster protein (DUF4445 family)